MLCRGKKPKQKENIIEEKDNSKKIIHELNTKYYTSATLKNESSNWDTLNSPQI